MAYETNYDRYKELCSKYKVCNGTYAIRKEIDKLPYAERDRALNKALEEYDVVVEYAGSGYAHQKYSVLRNVPNLNTKDLAIICDQGNLCFGYRTEGSLICVHTD